MKEDVLCLHQDLPAPREAVFAFFSDPRNLERLTPPWLSFRILTDPVPVMGEGTLIDYRLSLHGLPLRWRTLIERWEPGTCFVDRQIQGPYALWHHTHAFEDLPNGGTRVIDRVRFRVGFGLLGRLVAALFVRRDVTRIFNYRQQVLEQFFRQP